MPIDSSIAMGYQPIKLENPMNSLAQMMQIQGAQKQNQLADLTMQQHQLAIDETNKLNALYAGAINPDGTINRSKLFANAATGGLGAKIPGLQKGFLEADEAQGKVDKQKVDLVDSKLKQSRQLLDGVQTPEEYLAWHQGNHADPVLGPMLASRGVTVDSARKKIDEALQQPGGLQSLIQQSALGLDKFTEMNKPTIHTVDSGQVSTMYAVPGLGGAPTALNTTQKVATPDATLSSETTRRGQDMTDTRTRSEGNANRTQAMTLANQGVTYQDDGNGNLVGLPSKVAPGTAIKPISVLDANGNPLQSNKSNLNGDQSKAALYGSRMKQSDAILSELADKGVTTSNLGSSLGMGLGAAVTALSSSDKQRLDQAKRNFINATLRRESGAAIAPSEFDNAEKQYFPQIGDSAEVKAQKADNRASAINGMLIEIPKGQRDKVVTDILGDKGKPKSDNSGLPPDVAAALAKHGAR